MPGIVGYCLGPGGHASPGLLRAMASALEPQTRFASDLHQSESLGLGLVRHETVDMDRQPAWNEAHTVCAVMEGELYDRASLVQELRARGRATHAESDASLIVALFEAFGERFLSRLNGAFALAIWDGRAGKLLLANDRLGLCPLYYARTEGKLLFASGVRALLADPSLPRSVDRTAIGELLVFDHVLRDRTLLESARLLPQASMLTAQGDRLAIRRYWELRYPVAYPLRTEAEAIEGFLSLTRQAVERRLFRDDQSSGILLSGGLDSRFLLAYLRNLGGDRLLHAFTWGIPGCDDIRYARQAARITGARHHALTLPGDWLRSKAEEAVRITDGLANPVNLHAFANLEEETRHVRVLYKGFMGDALMGFGIRRALWADYTAAVRPRALMDFFGDLGLLSFTLDEVTRLLTPSFADGVAAAVQDDFASTLAPSGSRLLGAQCNYFYLTQRVPRMTIKGVEVARDRAIVRLPYADNDLVDFALTLIPGLLSERGLMKSALVRAFPRLAQIPITETGLPLMSCLRDVTLRAEGILRWHLRAAGLHSVAPQRRRPYKDYDRWFRTDLRDWVLRVLTADRTLDRGIFRPEEIQRQMAEHMAGRPFSVRLGALLAVELWHRQFIDGEKSEDPGEPARRRRTTPILALADG